jgi:hypothetical protein
MPDTAATMIKKYIGNSLLILGETRVLSDKTQRFCDVLS